MFLPMQHMEDERVRKHFDIPYPNFMNRVAKFCMSHNLKLVVKMHPDVQRNVTTKKTWRIGQQKVIDKCFKRLRKIMGSKFIRNEGSIHLLCQRCVFMANVNSGS